VSSVLDVDIKIHRLLIKKYLIKPISTSETLLLKGKGVFLAMLVGKLLKPLAGALL